MSQALITIAGAVLALAGLWSLWLRRTVSTGRADAIRVVTSRHLGTKQLVTLIEVDGERLLLGVTGENVSLVARLGGEQPVTRGSEGPGGAAPSDYRGAKAAPPGPSLPRDTMQTES
jgi:flagellar protein FliO/FliZ